MIRSEGADGLTHMLKRQPNRTSSFIIYLVDEAERIFDRLWHFFERIAPRALWLILDAIGAYAVVRKVFGR